MDPTIAACGVGVLSEERASTRQAASVSNAFTKRVVLQPVIDATASRSHRRRRDARHWRIRGMERRDARDYPFVIRDVSSDIADPLILSKARVEVHPRFARDRIESYHRRKKGMRTRLSGVRDDGGNRSDDAATCENAKNTRSMSATTDTTSTPSRQAGDCPASRTGENCHGSTEMLPCPDASHDSLSTTQACRA